MSREQLKNLPQGIPEKTLGWILQMLENNAPLNIEGHPNAEKAVNLLREGKPGLAYFGPHRFTFDPIIVTRALEEYVLSRCLNVRFGWIASEKWHPRIEGVKSMNPVAKAAMRGWIHQNNYDWFPVTQSYIAEELVPEDKRIARGSNISSIREARYYLEEGNSLIAISPEGHRNKKTNGLQKAEKGSGYLLKFAFGLPIVLRMSRNPPFTKPTVIFGDLIDFYEAKAIAESHSWKNGDVFTIADAMMLRLTKHNLAVIKDGEDPKGVYEDKFIENM